MKKVGRSEVTRRTVAIRSRRRRSDAIRAAYLRAYADRRGLGDDLAGWTDEGLWPVE
jgi:hypothetical protein